VFGDIGGVETGLATAWAEDIGNGRNSIQVEFASGIGLDLVVFEYLLGGVLIARSPPVPTGQGVASTAATAGTTNVGPSSVHAVREGGVVVIGTDYREGDGLGGGAAGLGCLTALVQVDFQTEPICTDYVRAVPISATGAAMPDAYRAEIDGRSIGRFIITDGTVQ
jgi:hypothetical protein